MKTKLFYVIQFNMSEIGGGFLECDGTKEIRIYELKLINGAVKLNQLESFTLDVSQITEDEINEWIIDYGEKPEDYELEQL